MSASKDTGLRKGWIMRSHVGWRGERNTVRKSVETSPYQKRFKIFEGKSERDTLKKITLNLNIIQLIKILRS